MPNLFVDCDDTLALYCLPNGRCEHGDVHPYGSKWSPWVPNERLVEGIKAFRAENPEALIVVWSGGGKEYAKRFIDKLLPDLGVTAMDKWRPYTDLAKAMDIVVDDQWRSMSAETGFFAPGTLFYSPLDWPPEETR
jgi:hypothetical protein